VVQPSDSQLERRSVRVLRTMEDTPVTWIETADELNVTLHQPHSNGWWVSQELIETLAKCSEIAIDLEAHSYRSYQGFVCLMQVRSWSL